MPRRSLALSPPLGYDRGMTEDEALTASQRLADEFGVRLGRQFYSRGVTADVHTHSWVVLFEAPGCPRGRNWLASVNDRGDSHGFVAARGFTPSPHRRRWAFGLTTLTILVALVSASYVAISEYQEWSFARLLVSTGGSDEYEPTNSIWPRKTMTIVPHCGNWWTNFDGSCNRRSRATFYPTSHFGSH